MYMIKQRTTGLKIRYSKQKSGFWNNHSSGFYLSFVSDKILKDKKKKILKDFSEVCATDIVIINILKKFDRIKFGILLSK